MNNNDVIEAFFSRAFEDTHNDRLLDNRWYVVPVDRVIAYIRQLLAIPYEEFLYYLIDYDLPQITSKDVTQLSSLNAATVLMCERMLEEDNAGFGYNDVGGLFPELCTSQTPQALKKYGENQVKTSKQLGLTFEAFGLWYLDVLGYAYNRLSDEEKSSLLARTILRDPLYGRIVKSLIEGDANLMDFLPGLKETTINRRASGIGQILDFAIRESQKSTFPLGQVHFKKLAVSKPSISEAQKASEEILLCEKRIDKSFLTRGFTIPKSAIDKVEQIVGKKIERGETFDVKVEFNGLQYQARIYNLKFKDHDDIVWQMLWRGKPSIAEALQLFFAHPNEQLAATDLPHKDLRKKVHIYGVNGIFYIK